MCRSIKKIHYKRCINQNHGHKKVGNCNVVEIGTNASIGAITDSQPAKYRYGISKGKEN